MAKQVNKTLSVLLLLGTLASCSEGRNLYLSDALTTLEGMASYTQSPSFLLPATIQVNSRQGGIAKKLYYDGGTHRLYESLETEESYYEHYLYIEDNVLKECLLLDGAYTLIDYPFEVPESIYGKIASPYVYPVYEMLRVVPERALYALKQIEAGNEDGPTEYEVLSPDPQSVDLTFAKESEEGRFRVNAYIGSDYLRNVSITSEDFSFTADFAYSLPPFPDFPDIENHAGTAYSEAVLEEISQEDALSKLENPQNLPSRGNFSAVMLENNRISSYESIEISRTNISGLHMEMAPSGMLAGTMDAAYKSADGIYEVTSNSLGESGDFSTPTFSVREIVEEDYSSMESGLVSAAAVLSNQARRKASALMTSGAKYYADGDLLLVAAERKQALYYRGLPINYVDYAENDVDAFLYEYPPLTKETGLEAGSME